MPIYDKPALFALSIAFLLSFDFLLLFLHLSKKTA
ncbi:hypothetical protein EUBDOL_00573 [Amedibacillus dolichus DSM 3991]|uniref:Uncharacterized protein n=1 Tax=Amedibacillus dolichus DSM 3991 TaxID=428127 RepID=A8R9N2_9FIRM|nr:hypothetical protein EUBDOL_00573 [Amedibacillus dolichus DSM 3991]